MFSIVVQNVNCMYYVMIRNFLFCNLKSLLAFSPHETRQLDCGVKSSYFINYEVHELVGIFLVYS